MQCDSIELAGEFYIGSKGTLYYRRQNGSLSRFGIRIDEDGTIRVFDHLLRRWYALPGSIPDRSGGVVAVTVTREDG